jgi:hypothetical protein
MCEPFAMAAVVTPAHQHRVKVLDEAGPARTLQPASLSFADLQSICAKASASLKAVPVRESRSANILACYGFPGLRRHKSDDEVSRPLSVLTPANRFLELPLPIRSACMRRRCTMAETVRVNATRVLQP